MTDLGDLTQFVEEAEGEGTKFTYKGVKCEIPASPPLKAMMKAQNLMTKDGAEAELSEMELIEINKLFLGEETFDNLVDAGISIKGFEALLTKKILPNIYGLSDDVPEDTEGEPKEEEDTKN